MWGKIKKVEDEVEKMSMDDRSCYSISTGLLPSLGAQSCRKNKLRRYIINPTDRRYRYWEGFLVMLVFYTLWVCPFELGFLEVPEPALSTTDNVVNGFFAIDIIVTFFVAYLDKVAYVLIDDPKLIAWRYAKTWLILDVISVIPSEAIKKVLPNSLKAYGYFNMLRLWRLRRISNMFARLEKDLNFDYFWVRCIKLMCIILYTVHFAAALFYLLAVHHKDPKETWIGQSNENFREENLWAKYLTSIYWAVTTFTTIGYGDLHPVNPKEMTFVIIYMLFSMVLTAYLIGNITNLVVHGTSRTKKFRDTIKAAKSFGQRHRIPSHLQDQMLAHLIIRFRTDSEGLRQQEILDLLPRAIQSSISNFLFYPIVDKAYLFRGVSNDLLFQLVAEMKAEYFPPKEDVILQNEAPANLYILVNGAVELITQESGMEQVVGELKTGDVFGEIGMLCYRPQPFKVRTKRLSQLLRLNRTAFLNIVHINVGDGAIIMNNVLQHLKGRKDSRMEKVLEEIEHMVTQGRMDVPLSLRFAAMRGDDLLLNRLLRRGDMDPNESDNDGRTALHIAASIGSLECVHLLLDNGADPNTKDTEGSVPLWDAMIGKHESIITSLLENGAKITSGDVGQFAYFAVEQNDMDLLKEIVNYGGDVTLPNSLGTTALHKAVTEENMEIIDFLVKQGANIDKPDRDGWTPRALAEYQGHNEMKALFQTKQEPENQQVGAVMPEVPGGVHLKKYQSEPMMPRIPPEVAHSKPPGTWSNDRLRRTPSSFNNSLFGIMSSANSRQLEAGKSLLPSPKHPRCSVEMQNQVSRITVSCPEKGEVSAKLIHLPKSLQELLDIGGKRYDFSPTKVLTKEGALIEDIEIIRDGDHLILASD